MEVKVKAKEGGGGRVQTCDVDVNPVAVPLLAIRACLAQFSKIGGQD